VIKFRTHELFVALPGIRAIYIKWSINLKFEGCVFGNEMSKANNWTLATRCKDRKQQNPYSGFNEATDQVTEGLRNVHDIIIMITSNRSEKTTGSNRDVVSAACSRLYCIQQEPHLGTRKLDRQIHQRKTNWPERLQKIQSERAPKQLLYCRVSGFRDSN
jgi:hypothetical protein